MQTGASIYLDNAATSPPYPEVTAAVSETMTELVGNPSAAHARGSRAARALSRARETLTAFFGPERHQGNVILTSGGTEANALGLLGSVSVSGGASLNGVELVSTAFEHPSVAGNLGFMENRGATWRKVTPDNRGQIATDAVLSAVTPETRLVAVMWVNNEIGSIQPIEEIGAQLKARFPQCRLHVDAVQAAGVMPLTRVTAVADSVAISAHKFGGPGALVPFGSSATPDPRPFGGGGLKRKGCALVPKICPELSAWRRPSHVFRLTTTPVIWRSSRTRSSRRCKNPRVFQVRDWFERVNTRRPRTWSDRRCQRARPVPPYCQRCRSRTSFRTPHAFSRKPRGGGVRRGGMLKSGSAAGGFFPRPRGNPQ